MPLNKLQNFIKNTEGRILYVSPSDLDATDGINNQGNSLAVPFRTLQRSLLEAARFSYQKGNSNDDVEKTTILLMPGAHTIDNRPGFAVYNDSGTARAVSPGGTLSAAIDTLSLTLDSNFDLTQDDNILYKFNSINGGVVVPRGTSVVGLDLRKTKLRPKYVPNPTDSNVPNSAIFRITGACYFWQFCFFDGSGLVYTDPRDFSVNNQSDALFSHHKLTCFEYADGVNNVGAYGLTDLDMYYAKLSNAFNLASGRDIDEKYPTNPLGFEKQRPEWEIVGAFASDPINISTIEAGSDGTPTNQVTVKTTVPHELSAGTPIKIKGVSPEDYNISTTVQSISTTDSTVFTYLLPSFRLNLPTPGSASGSTVTIETDTVSGASPYIFNISLRSVYGMNGMHADGSKASGFRSMVVAQFTGVSLQKDDRAFVKYNSTSRIYEGLSTTRVAGSTLSSQSSSTNLNTAYHLEPLAIYRKGWESSHIKASNDSFIQIVSVFAIGFNKHFDSQSGADFSITNSNSNFGQFSISASGFKKEAFEKDNKSFITSIIAPRAIVAEEDEIEWFSLDVINTISAGISTHLYLYGFTSVDDVPPILTQGYRVGAKVSDKLYFVGNGTEYSANILMSDGSTSSVKQYSTSAPSSNSFTIGSNTLQTGESVIILSDDGDLPENIVGDTVYYVINNGDNNTIKLASSASNAETGTAITVYGGTTLKILSRVSDKIAGDLGHPVQFDTLRSQWYIITNSNSDIYNAIVALGVAVLTERTEPSYIKRTADTRSLDEKLYKIRVVIPKELTSAKNPENGFIIQPSSKTGYRNNNDFTATTLTSGDYEYNRNLSFISNCTRSSTTVTIVSEIPHNLQVGDSVIIKNVTDTSNTIGADNLGYNGTFTVASVVNDMTFTYTTTVTSTGTPFTNNTANRTTLLPRFERNNLQSNLYVYRNEVISEYIQGTQDGVYHIYVLTADKAVTTEFTDLKYSQNVVDLYPQLDRDNINDSPLSSKSFAKRSPIGEVTTNDLKKSITKEATDTLLTTLGIGLDISSVSNSTTSATVTFSRNHGLAGVVNYNTLIPGTTYTDGTYHNVKLFNDIALTDWRGATARVVVAGGGVASADIVSSGSGYSAGTLYFDSSRIGTSNGRFNITSSNITTAIGNVVQFTGSTTTADGYYRITTVGSNTVSIAKTAGDPVITTDQYAFIVGPSVQVQNTIYDSNTGIRTYNCYTPHGLIAGNRFTVIDSTNNNKGSYIVKEKVGINTFTAYTPFGVGSADGYILKHGLSANDATSDSSAENLAVRSIPLFDKETLTAVSFTSSTQIRVSSPVGSSGIAKRLSLGSYIQIDEEIMRVVSSTLGGTFTDEITVIRGALATKQSTHINGSIIKKIKPIAIEFRRPSIARASGHTFEYLGYGPGNYSTGLPQVQITSLTEREEFLVQSQERSGGVVVYTGMNSNGDVYNGNTKTSSSSGEVISYDIPKPTVTGEDPSRLSAVFDEVTIKERLIVEGGNSGTVLSQFNGPVTFNKDVKFNGTTNFKTQLKVTSKINATSPTTGSLVVSGGTGISGNLYVGGNIYFNGSVGSGAGFGNITLAQTDDNTINTSSGNLKLSAVSGSKVAITTSVTINGNLDMTAGSGRISANYLDVPNISPIASIIMWPGTISNFPTGWAVCNGGSLSTTTYASLFTVLGYTYGGSGGSFNLPNLTNRFIVGSGTEYSVGNTGGLKEVTLSTAQLPKHSHIITDNGHDHTITDNGHDHTITEPNGGQGHRHPQQINAEEDGDGSGSGGAQNSPTSNFPVNTNYAVTGIAINSNSTGITGANSNTTGITGANSNTTGITGTNIEGNDTAHENRPPYFALIYLIRIQ